MEDNESQLCGHHLHNSPGIQYVIMTLVYHLPGTKGASGQGRDQDGGCTKHVSCVLICYRSPTYDITKATQLVAKGLNVGVVLYRPWVS